MNSAKDDPTFSEQTVNDLSIQHLYAEFARLDLLLRRQIDRWRAAGQDPADAFRGLYVSDQEADRILRRPLGGAWGDFANIDEEAYQHALKEADLRIQAILNRSDAINNLRLVRLVHLFNLNAFEKDVLLLALAPAVDLRYQRIYGYLQDDVTRKAPTVNLALDLLSSIPHREKHLACFNPTAALYRHQILIDPSPQDTLLSRALQLDHAVSAWLLGYDQTENLYEPETATATKDVHEIELPTYHPELILSLTGADQHGQHAALIAFSMRTEKPLLTIDVASFEDDASIRSEISRNLRDACLLGALPVFKNWDSVLKDDSPSQWILARILDFPDMVLVCSRQVWRPRGIDRSRRIHRVDFPVPGFRSRLGLWKKLLEDHPDSEALDLNHLAGQFALTTGQIHDAFEAAQDAAGQRGGTIETGDLLAAARSHSNPRLGALARKIEPRFGWDDIILPREQITILREITSTVRQQPKVLDDWGVGIKLASSRGVTVLFAGPPGTGKTMAAEIMAEDLGLDLYKIDLSGVVSKYIGETEKNLEKVFEEAASSNAILFFDEADALFGKRSEVRDAHDRYANLEISYLLQKMEAYDGMTILATNLRANLDDAFTRRLQFAVDFPFPEAPDRFRIWCALFPSGVPREPELDFELMAQRFRLAGGNIRNVIVTAAYLAAADGGTVTMGHMLHATRRELQKMGRLVNEEDLTPTIE